MKHRNLYSLFAVTVVAFATGCVGTSHGFKTVAKATVGDITTKMDTYQAADSNATVEQKSKVSALRDTVAVDKLISVDAVEAAWVPVQPMYRDYVMNDPRLQVNLAAQQDRLRTMELLNAGIEKERKRQQVWFNFGTAK